MNFRPRVTGRSLEYKWVCCFEIWRVVRDVLHRDQRQVHSDSQCQTLASGFSQFFIDKLARIRQSIGTSLLQSSGQVFGARMHTGPTLSSLAPTSAAEVLKLLTSRPLKSSRSTCYRQS